jgi:hypothetical protein
VSTAVSTHIRALQDATCSTGGSAQGRHSFPHPVYVLLLRPTSMHHLEGRSQVLAFALIGDEMESLHDRSDHIKIISDIRSDQIRSDQIRSDQIRSDIVISYQIISDHRSDKVNKLQIRSERIEDHAQRMRYDLALSVLQHPMASTCCPQPVQ